MTPFAPPPLHVSLLMFHFPSLGTEKVPKRTRLGRGSGPALLSPKIHSTRYTTSTYAPFSSSPNRVPHFFLPHSARCLKLPHNAPLFTAYRQPKRSQRVQPGNNGVPNPFQTMTITAT